MLTAKSGLLFCQERGPIAEYDKYTINLGDIDLEKDTCKKKDNAMTMETALAKHKNTGRRPDFMALYQRVYPAVARHVAKRGGTLEEAKDIFHDALLVYYEKVFLGVTVLQHNDAAYIFGIARYLWARRYAQNLRHVSLDQLMAGFEASDTDNDWPDNPSKEVTAAIGNRILHVLRATGQQCMDLLTAFYYEKLDMQALADRFGYSGTRSATVQKFKCLQKVKEVVKRKSLQYEDFVE